MGQLIEWLEVVTEGKTLEECRDMLRDALDEMVAAYREQGKEIPMGRALLEQVKRHSVLDRITANEICKQAGLKPKF